MSAQAGMAGAPWARIAVGTKASANTSDLSIVKVVVRRRECSGWRRATRSALGRKRGLKKVLEGKKEHSNSPPGVFALTGIRKLHSPALALRHRTRHLARVRAVAVPESPLVGIARNVNNLRQFRSPRCARGVQLSPRRGRGDL